MATTTTIAGHGFIMPFKVILGEVASGTGVASVTGIPFTPDVCIWETVNTTNDNAKSWSATANTLTLTGRSATTATGAQFLAAKVT